MHHAGIIPVLTFNLCPTQSESFELGVPNQASCVIRNIDDWAHKLRYIAKPIMLVLIQDIIDRLRSPLTTVRLLVNVVTDLWQNESNLWMPELNSSYPCRVIEIFSELYKLKLSSPVAGLLQVVLVTAGRTVDHCNHRTLPTLPWPFRIGGVSRSK